MHDIGILMPGKSEIILKIPSLQLGTGIFYMTFAIFQKSTINAESVFYTSPMSIWGKTHALFVQHRERHLSYIYSEQFLINKRVM